PARGCLALGGSPWRDATGPVPAARRRERAGCSAHPALRRTARQRSVSLTDFDDDAFTWDVPRYRTLRVRFPAFFPSRDVLTLTLATPFELTFAEPTFLVL